MDTILARSPTVKTTARRPDLADAKRRFDELFRAREPYMKRWREIRDYELPFHGEFDEQKADMKTRKIYNPTARDAAGIFAGGVMSGLTPPSRQWFKLALSRDVDDRTAALVLDSRQEIMQAVLARSNFYHAVYNCYADLPFGQAPMGIFGTDTGVRFVHYPIGSYALGTNAQGEVDVFARKVKMTARQITEAFGEEACPRPVREAARKRQEVKFTVCWLLEPNTERRAGVGAQSMPYRSLYWVDGARGYLAVGGMEEWAVSVARYQTIGLAPYAKGAGWYALDDSKMLQVMERDVLLAIEMGVNPPMQTSATTAHGLNLFPGGVTVTEVKTGDKVTGYKVGLDDTVKVGNVAIDGKGDKGEITGLTNTTLDAEGFATKGRAATEEQLQAAMNKAITGSKTTVKAGDDNITVTEDAKTNTYTVALNEDITAKSVTAGKAKISDDGVSYDGKTYIGKDGLNANGKKVTNVAAGTLSKDSKDAVNGSQLFATNENVAANTKNIENNAKQITNLNQNVTKLGGDIADLRDESREGDALNAALSALKPLDFDPLQRSQIMAGVSTYKGKQAVALGLAHYSNEDTLVHGGISYAGSSELMANLGISWRFGDKADRAAQDARNARLPQYAAGPMSSVYVMQDEMAALRAENLAVKERMAAIEQEANTRIAALEAQVQALLDAR